MTAKDRGRHVSHCEPRLGRRPRNGSARAVASPALPPGLRPRRLPLSWGKGCSSAWLPWLRNCDEPWERFCLCALRTDFRVKPSTFSEAEMAALAAPAGGDDDDISAALALGSSGCCFARNGQRQAEEAGRGAGSSRPSAPSPRPHRPPAPGAAELLLAAHRRLTATSQGRGFLVPAARRARGLAGARAGAEGVKKLLTPGAEGGCKGA